jgi:hypothetical protein
VFAGCAFRPFILLGEFIRMTFRTPSRAVPIATVLAAFAGGLAALPASAQGIQSEAQGDVADAFDLVETSVDLGTRWLTFSMVLAGDAGEDRPEPVGSLAGAPVAAHVWPTDLDPSVAGFPEGSGQLAFVITSHPDFDDTPLYDENDDGDWENDGLVWHSHWVVLTEDDACAGGLKVRDIGDTDPAELPATWPNMPIYLSSPGYTPLFGDNTLRVRVPFATPEEHAGMAFDGVTAALEVNPDLEEPMLCVTEVYDIASGDLSLPGRVPSQ